MVSSKIGCVRRARPLVLAFVVLATLADCGGSGDGSGAMGSIAIDFPPPSSTDQGRVAVRGHAARRARLGGVQVNGTAASSDDGFQTWIADVPLTPGANALVAEALDGGGRVVASSAPVTIEQAPLPVSPHWLAIDAASGNLYVVGGPVERVDLATGSRAVVSGPGRGSGPDLVNPQGLALDASRGRLLVTDDGLAAVVAIDLGSGDRTILSDDTHGAGPSLGGGGGTRGELWGTVIAGDEVIVANAGGHAIYAADLASGDRRIVSDHGHGSGPPLQFSRGLALDAARNRVVSAQDPTDPVLAIDLTTGDRTVLATSLLGEAEGSRPRAIAVDPATDSVLVEDLGAVVAVDLATGAQSLASPFEAPGPQIPPDPLGGALDVSGRRLLVTVPGAARIIAVDLTTGQRSYLFGRARGTGDGLVYPQALASDPRSQRTQVADSDRIVEIDAATGNRRVVSGWNDAGETIGAGPGFAGITGIALDRYGERLLVSDVSGSWQYATSRVLAVDLTDGTRAVVSSDDVGDGEPVHVAAGLARDPVSERLVVLDSYPEPVAADLSVLAIDPTTGERTIVSDFLASLTSNTTQLAVSNGHGYFAAIARIGDASQSALFDVDLTSGDSAILTDGGSGKFFQGSGGLALDESGKTAWMGVYSSTGPYSLEPAILAIDLTASPPTRTLVSSDSHGRGPSPVPVALATTDEPHTLRALIGNALVAIDLVSGDRVYLSE